MKVLERAVTPNGIAIQTEEWKDGKISIGAYPIARNTGKYKWVEAGDNFRLSINRNWNSCSDVLDAFNGLIEGSITLEDLADHFWYGDKDKWYLGMEVQYLGW
ncbi:MAG: hypothetical protein ACRC1P_09860 [Cellulosilyticaceae bacterium]